MKERLRRKLLDLMAKRTELVNAAGTAIEADKKDEYDKAMQDVADIDAKIKDVTDAIAALEAAPAAPPASAAPSDSGTVAVVNDRNAIRASNEYARAFCNAVRAGLTRETARNVEGARILLDALTEGTDADGGFLVPVDLQTRINELSRQFVDLSQFVNVENVTTLTGFRVLDTAPTKGFTQISEMAQIPLDDQPAFSRIGYSVKDYALIVPVSNDLLQDNDAGLMAYLARWMAKKSVLTKNSLILAKLATATATNAAAGKELATIKKALNVALDPDISLNAAIITNQTGYDVLDKLNDTTGRPLLQPDVTTGTGYQVKGKHITAVANRILADDDAGSPVYVGDFRQFLTIFQRMPMEFTTTNIGGSAWRTNSTEGRAIMRLDIQTVDKAAAAAVKLEAGKSTAAAG